MNLRAMGERDAIKRLRKAIGETGDLGRGRDDCAVLPGGAEAVLLASTDMVLGNTHMLPGVTPRMLGRFATEIAVSDVAAMGGWPLAVLCGYAMPPETDIHWLEEVSKGMAEAARDLGTWMMGGDTKASPEPTIAVTALGSVNLGQCMFRNGARKGDALLLTGPVGGPALGFNMERNPDGTLTDRALELVYGVRARVRAGVALAKSGHAHACIDLSDGLAPCLAQLMEASGKGALLEWDCVPLVDGMEEFPHLRFDLQGMALNWGGEYELLAAVDPAGVEPLMRELGRLGLVPAIVGTVHGDPRKNIIRRGRALEDLKTHGFDHFRT